MILSDDASVMCTGPHADPCSGIQVSKWQTKVICIAAVWHPLRS